MASREPEFPENSTYRHFPGEKTLLPSDCQKALWPLLISSRPEKKSEKSHCNDPVFVLMVTLFFPVSWPMKSLITIFFLIIEN